MNEYKYTPIKMSPFKWFVLENFPFIEEDFDSLTSYGLWCKLKQYFDKVATKTNGMGTQVESLTNAFIKLKDYVDNYFKNLDVQEEINNKLDIMVEDGTLENILYNYSNVQRIYNTTIEMLADYSNIYKNMKIKTLGYYSKNDGGGCEFYITDSKLSDFQILLANNLYANPCIKNKLYYVNQLGAHGDGINDDSVILNNIFSQMEKDSTIVFNPNSSYLINNTLMIPYDTDIIGNNCKIIKGTGNFYDNYMIYYNIDSSGNTITTSFLRTAKIRDLQLIAPDETFETNNGIYICQQAELCYCTFTAINKCCYFTDDYVDRFEMHHCYIRKRYSSTEDYAIFSGNQGDAKFYHDIQSGASSNHNLIRTGNNLIACTIERIVNGSIRVQSPTYMNQIMLSYNCKIEMLGCSCVLKNIHLTKNQLNEHRIIFSNSDVSGSLLKRASLDLENLNAFYTEDAIDNVNNQVSCIYIDGYDSLKLTNVYTGIRTNRSYKRVRNSYEKIDFNNSTCNLDFYNKNPHLFNGKLLENSVNYDYKFLALPNFGINNINITGVEFNGEKTRYYYCLNLGDFETGITYGDTNEYDVDLTNTTGAPNISISTSRYKYFPLKLRIYRGTTPGVYNAYADIVVINNVLTDNGLTINGIQWKYLETPHQRNSDSNMPNSISVDYIANIDGTYNRKIKSPFNPVAYPSRYTHNEMDWKIGDIVEKSNSPFGIDIYDGTNWVNYIPSIQQ